MFSVIFNRDVFALLIESMSYMHTEFLQKNKYILMFSVIFYFKEICLLCK